MKIAILCSAHGFGHVARQMAVAEALIARGAAPTLFTAAPPGVVRRYLPGASIQPWRMDVGIHQRDSLTEDLPRTLARLPEVCGDAAIDRLAGALAGFDRAIVDVAPAGLAACRRAGVPALAVGNFDWPWIYRAYAAAPGGAGLAAWADRFAAWQAPHPAMSLSPGPGLSGFASVEPAGLLGRSRPAARPEIPAGERAVLASFGGFGLDLGALLPRLPGVVWVTAPPAPRLARPDVIRIDDAPYPALVAGADAVLTKPGYGIFAESALAGAPIVWIDRGAFPEAPHLEAAMRARGDVEAEAAGPGGALQDLHPAIGRALSAVWSRPRPPRVPGEAAARIARRILAD